MTRLALALWALLLPVAAHADGVDDIVVAEMKRQHSPAVAVAIVRHGQPLKVAGYGSANLEHRAPATADTFFQTASVGKQFTAVLVMLLVRDGRLSLDAPLATWLPDAPEAWRAITVRQLLNHTAGLPADDPAIDLRRDYTEAELLASAFRVLPAAAPGERHAYSNLGYQVLGVLCSRVGGRHWSEQLQARVFRPLGMRARVISEAEITVGRAAGYDRVDGRLQNQAWVAPSQNTTADGSLYVSARDMARWGQALQGTGLLGAAEKQALWQPATLAGGSRVDYGFGWALERRAGHRLISHDGAWQGFSTFLLHLPEDRLTIAVLMNRSNAQPREIAERLLARQMPALRQPPPVVPTNAQLLQQTIHLGARFDEGTVRVGRPHPLAHHGGNLVLQVDAPGPYTFQLDLRGGGGPSLTLRPGH